MQFGSTEREDVDEGMIVAHKTSRKAATLAGMNVELQIQKQQIKKLHEELAGCKTLMASILNEFQDFKKQRGIELARMVNGGPTEG